MYFHIEVAAIRARISLTRWQTSITTMTKKISRNPWINKLRVLHLYKADYNVLLKILWARHLVWHARDHNKINDGQAGSQPGRNAIAVVIQKETKYLYSRQKRTGMGTMENNAKT
jgi:hypothetical protein